MRIKHNRHNSGIAVFSRLVFFFTQIASKFIIFRSTAWEWEWECKKPFPRISSVHVTGVTLITKLFFFIFLSCSCVRWSLRAWRSRSTRTCEVVGTSSTGHWSSSHWSTSSFLSPHQPVLASSASSVSSGCCAPLNRSGVYTPLIRLRIAEMMRIVAQCGI